jgi:hypothetical protein
MDTLESLGNRIDVVRTVKESARSDWARSHWTLVELQLMRKLKELSYKIRVIGD